MALQRRVYKRSVIHDHFLVEDGWRFTPYLPHYYHSKDNQAKLLVTVNAQNEATTMITLVGIN
jgi:hypothetical protein